MSSKIKRVNSDLKLLEFLKFAFEHPKYFFNFNSSDNAEYTCFKSIESKYHDGNFILCSFSCRLSESESIKCLVSLDSIFSYFVFFKSEETYKLDMPTKTEFSIQEILEMNIDNDFKKLLIFNLDFLQ